VVGGIVFETAGHFGGLDGAEEEVAGAELAEEEEREGSPR